MMATMIAISQLAVFFLGLGAGFSMDRKDYGFCLICVGGMLLIVTVGIH